MEQNCHCLLAQRIRDPPREYDAMDQRPPHLDTLLNLENMHEDLLRQLDELDKRVECTLKEWQDTRSPADAPRRQ